MTNFQGLVAEVGTGESRLLADGRVGAYLSRRLIVQRADGSIVEAWDLYSDGRDVAQPWGLVPMEYVYKHAQALFPEPGALDVEALGHAIARVQALDEACAILDRAS